MRYFIVSYNYKDNNGSIGHSSMWFASGKYPSRIEIKSTSGFPQICILNIMELNQEDYYSFVSDSDKEKPPI
jgi:hypothetical protein